jgi:hypothetical protein
MEKTCAGTINLTCLHTSFHFKFGFLFSMPGWIHTAAHHYGKKNIHSFCLHEPSLISYCCCLIMKAISGDEHVTCSYKCLFVAMKIRSGCFLSNERILYDKDVVGWLLLCLWSMLTIPCQDWWQNSSRRRCCRRAALFSTEIPKQIVPALFNRLRTKLAQSQIILH